MKKQHKEDGAYGEELAMSFLVNRGVRILQKNFRCRHGEIDLVGWDGEYYIFVEVKKRASFEQGYPCEAVGYHKQRKICLTADYYRMKYKLDEFVPIRFDIVEVNWHGQCRWIKNAFGYYE